MTPKAKLKALDQLKSSRGWKLVEELMEAEMVAAAMQIANTPSMTLDEINFRRGAIWAADQLRGLPDRMIRNAQADLVLTPDDKSKPDET